MVDGSRGGAMGPRVVDGMTDCRSSGCWCPRRRTACRCSREFTRIVQRKKSFQPETRSPPQRLQHGQQPVRVAVAVEAEAERKGGALAGGTQEGEDLGRAG